MIQVETFRLAPDGGEEDFLTADRRVQTELVPFIDGFVRRTTARSLDGPEWTVVTLWASPESADEAEAALAHEPAGLAFLSAIDPTSRTWRRYQQLD
jgi:heme-degrading monooxygenase HmoA